MIPDGDGQRMWRSDFPMRSDRVRAVVESGAVDRQRVAWSDYGLDYGEFRVALALNPCEVSVHPDEARATVFVRYPPNYKLVLFSYGGHRFMVEEGLFWALQEVGWYHPYSATWTWEQ